MARNLILTGGIRHPFGDASRALAAILSAHGIASEITEDIEHGLSRLGRDGFDMVTIYALRWRMLGDQKYAQERSRWGFSLSANGRRGLTEFVASGGGLLGLHTASLCFDDWEGWKDVLGAVWMWGRSHHPPYGRVEVTPTATGHEITAGLGAFELNDEVYSGLELTSGIQPLLTATPCSTPSENNRSAAPVLWARSFGRGRVVYDALGHDRSSLEHPIHGHILARSARWLRGEAGANIEN